MYEGVVPVAHVIQNADMGAVRVDALFLVGGVSYRAGTRVIDAQERIDNAASGGSSLFGNELGAVGQYQSAIDLRC